MAAKMRVSLAVLVWLAVALVLATGHGWEQMIRAESRQGGVRVGRHRHAAPLVLAQRDLHQIRAKKTLTVLAPYNSTTYFIYRGEPMGYEYDLLKAFAKQQGVALKLVVVRNGDQLFEMLRRGEGDVAAARLVPPAEGEAAQQGLAFTKALYRTKPTLVQQKQGKPDPHLSEPVKQVIDQKEGAGAAEGLRVNVRLITRPAQLAGRQVELPRRSPYRRTLLELSDEVSGDIHVVEAEPNVDSEALIEHVAKGETSLTVAQKNLADLKESVYTNLIVIPTLGPPHPISWAVRRNSPQLLDTLNEWIEKKQNHGLFAALYRKYFIDRDHYRQRQGSPYLTSRTGRLCKFDPLLKRYAPEVLWDWRLLASQTYQESHFDPDARSWAGAQGLLQLMPKTARGLGVQDRGNPEQSVRGGVKYLRSLEKYWRRRIPEPSERLKFVLASYNAGPGHVDDAQRLTRKYGGDPNRWDDVAYWMLQLSQKEYYTDPVVRSGFCRGTEPVSYVGLILARWDQYRQTLPT